MHDSKWRENPLEFSATHPMYRPRGEDLQQIWFAIRKESASLPDSAFKGYLQNFSYHHVASEATVGSHVAV